MSRRRHVLLAPLLVCAVGCPEGPDLTDGVSSSSTTVNSATAETVTETTSTTGDTGDTSTGPGGSMTADATGATQTTATTTNAATGTTSGVEECGNGIPEGDEECDDGNADNDDDCLNSCLLPYCGDGIVREEFGEECDDGDLDDADGCNNQCGLDRYVFLTSTDYGGSFGGVSGANSQCKQLAEAAGLPNHDTYRAWMSDESFSPAEWFFQSKGRYIMTNGVLVAHDWEDLTDGTIENPIQVDENGDPTGNAGVWTNTTPSGLPHPDSADCSGWSTQEFPIKGRVGENWKTNAEWTDAENNNPTLCASTASFYCFEN